MTSTPTTSPLEPPPDLPLKASSAAIAPKRSLKALALRGSAWTFGGYVASQGLRFASNIILAKLLFPQAFGLMSLAAVFLQGLQMFSDIGIGPSIIQNKRGGEQEFLNTAWTIQSIRGIALWLASCALAWPAAKFFGEPALLWIIPVCGFTTVINGFNSTALVTLNRQMFFGKLTVLDIAGQCLSIGVMVVWAKFHPSVWALIAGSFVDRTFRLVMSYHIVPGHRNRFQWNREDARSMFRFGRWVFFSTVLTFFAMQTDKMLVQKKLGTAMLGIYGIAYFMATFAPQLVKRIGGGVSFPVLSEIVRERPETLRRQLQRIRIPMLGLSLLFLLPLVLLGELVIRIFYDARYASAGWMLQVLATGAIVNAVCSSAHQVLLPLGRTFVIAMLLAMQIAVLIAATLIGYHFWAEHGVVVAVASVELLNYPFLAFVLWRLKLWQPKIDLTVMAIAAAAGAAGYCVTKYLL